MNYERLEKTAALLDKIPPQAFDMDVWQSTPVADPFDGTFECGFAGCAVGWVIHAGLIPGLTFSENGVPRYRAPAGVAYDGWEAIEHAYGIGHGQAHDLFSNDGYHGRVHPGDVADRITTLVKNDRLKERYG